MSLRPRMRAEVWQWDASDHIIDKQACPVSVQAGGIGNILCCHSKHTYLKNCPDLAWSSSNRGSREYSGCYAEQPCLERKMCSLPGAAQEGWHGAMQMHSGLCRYRVLSLLPEHWLGCRGWNVGSGSHAAVIGFFPCIFVWLVWGDGCGVVWGFLWSCCL